jgi:hypothetical protein
MQNIIRIDNPQTVNPTAIAADLAQHKAVVIQFTQTPNSSLLDSLNALCQQHDDQLTIRFYSDAFDVFDCTLLRQLPQLKSLELDCMMRAKHLEVLTELAHLKRLNLGVYELKETEILAANHFKSLIELTLGATKSKALNLEHLQHLTQLKHLFIEGHTKHIEAISALSQLNDLRLHGVSKVPLTFINPLKQLKSLTLTLGGRVNLDEVTENSIEHLNLGRVRGFSHLNNLAQFSRLKTLHISEQIQLETLDLTGCNKALQAITLHDCKTLSTLTGLANLSALRYLRIWRTNLAFEKLLASGTPDTLTHFSFFGNKNKENAGINAKLSALGYQEANWSNLPKI